MAKQFQLTEDTTLTNSNLNSPVKLPQGAYFSITVCYPKGYIKYSLEFWQEVDGEVLEHQWNRQLLAVENNDMGSRQKALNRLFNELLPELKAVSKKV